MTISIFGLCRVLEWVKLGTSNLMRRLIMMSTGALCISLYFAEFAGHDKCAHDGAQMLRAQGHVTCLAFYKHVMTSRKLYEISLRWLGFLYNIDSQKLRALGSAYRVRYVVFGLLCIGLHRPPISGNRLYADSFYIYDITKRGGVIELLVDAVRKVIDHLRSFTSRVRRPNNTQLTGSASSRVDPPPRSPTPTGSACDNPASLGFDLLTPGSLCAERLP